MYGIIVMMLRNERRKRKRRHGGPDGQVVGTATEAALLTAAQQHGIDLAELAARPAQREVGLGGGSVDGDDDLFQEDAEQFLAIAVRGGGRGPHAFQIDPQGEHLVTFRRSQRMRSLSLTAIEVAAIYNAGSGTEGVIVA